MIAWFKGVEMPIPIKFRLLDGEYAQVIKVHKIIQMTEKKLAGNKMFFYRCQSIIGNGERIYELKYEVEKCRWYLFKM